MKSIYSFSNYKEFLTFWLDSQPNDGRGVRRLLAEASGCQPAYISHVLAADRDLSLEQGEAIGRFIGLSSHDMEYFLLMIELARAGTPSLKKYFEEKLLQKKEQQSTISSRVKIKATISVEDQGMYYSSWHYQAIRMALTVPSLRAPASISKKLNIPISRVNEVLSFLTSRGLVKETPDGLQTTEKQIHLNSDSAFIGRMHANWRFQTQQQLESFRRENMHYSAAVTLSENDLEKIREALLEAIANCHQIIKPSKEEKLCLLALDFYEL